MSKKIEIDERDANRFAASVIRLFAHYQASINAKHVSPALDAEIEGFLEMFGYNATEKGSDETSN
jgi:hypothetical protein